jgi:hypothetical protein
MENRYSELKHDGKVYTEQWKIDEILIKNKFNWLVNSEIKNARLEIFQDTLIWNAGIWYNGDWYFGVWRDGEWRYGTWQNGVWYNGVWRNGTFKSGIIYKGKFFKGKIEGGEIRGGQFIETEISPNVKEYTEDEFQTKVQDQNQQNVPNIEQTRPIDNDKVRVHGTVNVQAQPLKIQNEKNNNNKMKMIKTYEAYKSAFEKFMLEWNGYDENDKWNSSNTLITKTLKEINDYIDENNLTMKDNLYKIKGWRNNKWEVLVNSNYKK